MEREWGEEKEERRGEKEGSRERSDEKEGKGKTVFISPCGNSLPSKVPCLMQLPTAVASA